MPSITFTQPDGTARTVDSAGCETLMHVVIKHNIAGIEAECGGQLICATCQVYLTAPIPPAGEDEQDMIGDLAVDPRPESRLACRIYVSDLPEEVAVGVPPRQR